MNKNSKSLSSTIGLEIHVELSTASKMFCGCSASHFRVKPNTHTCPICLGLPGALPTPNKKAVEWTVMIGLALSCKVSKISKFDRKHYFYPDLPKGFQISQYDKPLCTNGYLKTDSGKVRIKRVHLEEDTGKLIHKKVKGKDMSLIDFNRSGVPLVEIVTEPDMHSGVQVKKFAKKLQQIIRYLEVSDCDMEKGSMRFEANISWGEDLGYKVEIKNLNSFRFLGKGIDFELKRQKKLLDKKVTPKQETRGWDEKRDVTVPQRFKETESDYRYFPEPDIPPMRFDKSFIQSLNRQIPELPANMRKRFISEYKIPRQFADIIIDDKYVAKCSEDAFILAKKAGIKPKIVADEIVNKKIRFRKSKPADVVTRVKTLSVKVSDNVKISEWVSGAISNMPNAAKDYKSGKREAISAIMGDVMRLSKGRANAKVVIGELKKQLS